LISGSLGRLDHPVQHPEDVLLHRVGLVDVLDELLFQLVRTHLSSCLDPFQLELAELPPAKHRAAAVAMLLALEQVDEADERRAVAKRQPDDVERHARQRADLRRARCAGDPLAHPEQRRQRAAGALDLPDPFELSHSD
jgi:hypothetical protein